MGCTTSAPGPNAAYDIVVRAKKSQSPVDIGKLRETVKGISADQLNIVDVGAEKTALDQAVFCKNAAEACSVLLEAGANPLAQCPPRDLVATSIGIAARYEQCALVIPVLCKALNADGWKVIAENLGVHKSHEVGACVRVQHPERGKGTTSWNADKDKDMLTGAESGDIIAVEWDGTGTLSVVARKDLTVLSQLNQAAKEQFVASAQNAVCEAELIQTLESMEVGQWKPYGVA